MRKKQKHPMRRAEEAGEGVESVMETSSGDSLMHKHRQGEKQPQKTTIFRSISFKVYLFSMARGHLCTDQSVLLAGFASLLVSRPPTHPFLSQPTRNTTLTASDWCSPVEPL